MMDQDYLTMMRMTAALNVHDAMQAFRSAKGEAIHRVMEGPSGKLIAALKQEGYLG